MIHRRSNIESGPDGIAFSLSQNKGRIDQKMPEKREYEPVAENAEG